MWPAAAFGQPRVDINYDFDAVDLELGVYQLEDVGEDFVDVESARRLFRTVAREGAHVVDDGGHAVDLTDYILERGLDMRVVDLPVVFHAEDDAFGEGADSAEWLVELVGDTGGHFAQGPQLAGLHQVQLQLA